MRPSFPLFSNPIELAHLFWSQIVKEGDAVIDATLGNGKDTLMLAKLLNGSGKLIGLDIQTMAMVNTLALLSENLPKEHLSNIHLYKASHAEFPNLAKSLPIKLIVYNLGYLPGGDKAVTTLCDTTLSSINEGLKLLTDGGAVSITCYSGHQEGAVEQKALLDFVATLDNTLWSVTHHVWPLRNLSPSLLFIQKKNM